MARQAACVDLLGRSLLEKEKLGGVAGIRDVAGRRAMTRFAALLGWAAPRIRPRGKPCRHPNRHTGTKPRLVEKKNSPPMRGSPEVAFPAPAWTLDVRAGRQKRRERQSPMS